MGQHKAQQAAQHKFREELFSYSIPFWVEHGPDQVDGGFFTCLDRQGGLTSHDKSGWHQGRTAWTFSRLVNQFGPNETYLSIAKSCLDFINTHLIDPEDGRMYFSVQGDGTPLRKRRYPYNGSEMFAISGLAEYSRAANDPAALEQAKALLQTQLDNASGNGRPVLESELKYRNRPMQSWGRYMILTDVLETFCLADPAHQPQYEAQMKQAAEAIFRDFYKEELGCILETVGPNGEFLSDWSLGREINPGHGLEGVWFLARVAKRLNDAALLKQLQTLYDGCLAYGWDQEYGGILMFVDALGHPPEKYEHDMKFWWVINEAVCAALSLYEITGQARYWADFERFSAYYFSFFSDRVYGDCYGYLRRDGKPTEPIAKGNLYKGCFHNPRMMMHVIDVLTRLEGR